MYCCFYRCCFSYIYSSFKEFKIKNNIDTLVEFESGSNDPTAYMLTSVMLIFITSNESVGIGLLGMIFKQIVFGVTVGLFLSKLAVFILRKVEFEIEGLYPIFTITVAILAYSISEFLGGNGYLSVFIAGIVMGNSKIPHKKSLNHF